jgi:hypothetical protein
MGKSRNRSRIFAGGLAALLGLGSAAPASADLVGGTAVQRPAPDQRVAEVRRHGVRVPAGILAGVPSGASPGGVRLRTVYPPYPVGFAADPYFTPPAMVTVPPPIVFAPPPFFYDGAPIGLPFYGGCFVPSDNAGQHGYYGSCADAFYRQWMSRPD